MSDNFDIHAWNRNNLLESSMDDSELKAKERVDVITKNILKSFPELDKAELKYAVSAGMSDLVFDGLLESSSNKKYTVQYWTQKNDEYDDQEIDIMANSEEDALLKAKQSVRRGKDFKILNEDYSNPIDTITTDVPLFLRLLEYAKEDAMTDMDLHNVTENAIKLGNNMGAPLTMRHYNDIIKENNTSDSIDETFKFIMEDLEGYSKYFPGGKTKGLSTDEMSTILMRIIKDIEMDGKQLDESNLCKRGQDYIKSRKSAGEKSSAYLSGRAVRVCKGDIKFKDKKVNSYGG